MIYQDDLTDPDWKLSKVKTEPRDHNNSNQSSVKQKYAQKFCEKWLKLFSPWLARCDDDANKPFCRACQCRLDCNRCHLQRHEKTSKHARNLEILVNKGEGAARQNLSIRQERSKYYKQRKEPDYQDDSEEVGLEDDFMDESDNYFAYENTTSEDQYEAICKTENLSVDELSDIIDNRPAAKNNVGRPRKNAKNEMETVLPEVEATPPVTDRKEGMKLLLQIQKDKNELMDSFKELMGGNMPPALQQQQQQQQQIAPAREKNHVDLFFESVSSSVKALSPKLIAETKMRVSQLICELELRALTENEANNALANASTVVQVTQHSDNSAGTYIINQSIDQQEQYDHQLS